MIDIHSHILPDIDDGINTIFATPHYYRGHFENDYELVKNYVSDIKNWILKSNPDIQKYQVPKKKYQRATVS